MPRYIDADEYAYRLAKHMSIAENRQKKHGFRDAINMIDEFVVDVAPVVHGEWIKCVCTKKVNGSIVMSDDPDFYRCSRCGREELNEEPYCNCGAKMDKKQLQTEKSENL